MKSFQIGLVSGTSGLLFGYNVAIVAGALTFLTAEFQLSGLARESLVTSILVGAFAGAMLSGELAARWGERRVLLAAVVVFVLAPLGIAMAQSPWNLALARGALGLAVGTVSMVAPLYVGEMAHARRRGALVSLFQLGVTLGILGAYLVNLALTEAGDWRTMFALGAVPAVVLGLSLAGLPESQRWLGRGDKVKSDELMAADRDPIKRHWRDLFGPQLWPVLLVAGGLFLFQNMSGIDGILYYAPEIFHSVGVEAQTGAVLATVGLGAINVAATLAAMLMVDRLGRRPLLLGGLVIMTASLALLGGLIWHPATSFAEDWLTLILLGVFILAFAVSLGPLPYVLMSELFPVRVRSRGMSLATATSWASNIFVAMTFLLLLDGVGAGPTFLVYAGICLAAFIFSWRLVPETRGCSLEDIETNVRAGRRTRDLGQAI